MHKYFLVRNSFIPLAQVFSPPLLMVFFAFRTPPCGLPTSGNNAPKLPLVRDQTAANNFAAVGVPPFSNASLRYLFQFIIHHI